VRRKSKKLSIGYTLLLIVSHNRKWILGKNVSFVVVRIIDLLGALNIKLENVVVTTSQKYNMSMTKMS